MANSMRVLVRKREGQLYVQPSGEWLANRNTAKQFESSNFAYWWAHEKDLLGIDIVLAFEDPIFDIVPLRL